MPATDGLMHNFRPSIQRGKRVGQRGPRAAQATNGRLEITTSETGFSNGGFRRGYLLPAGVSHKPRSQSRPAVDRALARLSSQTPFLHAHSRFVVIAES
jgi:hypothetical protein